MARPKNRPNTLGVRVGNLDYERLLFLAKLAEKPVSTISAELLVQAARDRIREQIAADEGAERETSAPDDARTI